MAAAKRALLLDFLRSACVVIMVLYHGMYDVKMVYGTEYDYFDAPWLSLLQKTVLCLFIVISGMSFAISDKGRRNLSHYYRGTELLLAGTLISVSTYFFFPSEFIMYGVLTFFGLTMLITEPLLPLLRPVPKYLGLILSIFLAIGSKLWLSSLGYAHQDYLAVFGYRSQGFVSSDYVPLVPYIFVFWAGFYLYHLLKDSYLMSYSSPEWLAQLNNFCLPIYIFHQPVLLLMLRPFFDF